jgi:WD40 repeat protein
MGKSSLMARTATRLRREGTVVALLDLTAIGQNVTAAQWYRGLLGRLGRHLDIEEELTARWKMSEGVGPLQRWADTVGDVLFARFTVPIVIAIDEIDAVRSLPFSADEFFAGIRECHNRRADDPRYERLTFCLLGTASPSDLIADPRMTPFNVGRRIELKDFTPDEARPLARGLAAGAEGLAALARVLHWTDGHPFLTQRLCKAVAEEADGAGPSPADVDRACEQLFFGRGAREREDNLMFVADRLLRSDADPAALLTLYGRVRAGRGVSEEAAGPLRDALHLCGVVRTDDRGRLRVRNRIYARAFDSAWVRENLPDAELRRQQAAYRRGLARATGIAATVFAAVGVLTAEAVFQATRAREREAETARVLYVADMQVAQQALAQGNARLADELLDAHRTDVARGFEWGYLWGRLHRERLAIEIEPTPVRGVAYSPDGARIATIGDAEIRIWDARSGRLRASWCAFPGSGCAIAYSPGGARIAAVSTGTAGVWEAATGRVLAAWPVVSGGTTFSGIAFSPDGQELAVAGEFRVRTFRLPATARDIPGGSGGAAPTASTVCFGPGGAWIAVAGGDGAVRLWDRTGKQLMRVLSGHEGAVTGVAVSRDGSLLYSAGRDGTVRRWDVRTWRGGDVLCTAPRGLLALVLSSDGRTVATGGEDTLVRIVDARRGREEETFAGHQRPVTAATFSPDGTGLATGSWDGSLRVWDTRRGGGVSLWAAAPADLPHAFSPDGTRLAALLPGLRHIGVWDAATGERTATLAIAGATAITFTPDGKGVAVAYNGEPSAARGAGATRAAIRVYELTSGRLLREMPSPAPRLYSLAISPDGRTFAGGSLQNRVYVWDGAGGLPRTFAGPLNARALTFSLDGATLAAGSVDGEVFLWGVARGQESRQVLQDNREPVTALAFSPEGRVLACGCHGDRITLWQIPTRRASLTLDWERGEGTAALTFSARGDALIGLNRAGAVHAWRSAGPR